MLSLTYSCHTFFCDVSFCLSALHGHFVHSVVIAFCRFLLAFHSHAHTDKLHGKRLWNKKCQHFVVVFIFLCVFKLVKIEQDFQCWLFHSEEAGTNGAHVKMEEIAEENHKKHIFMTDNLGLLAFRLSLFILSICLHLF